MESLSETDVAVATGAKILRLAGFSDRGQPLVTVSDPVDHLAEARSTVALTKVMTGREVVVLFEGGDPSRPLIVGLLEQQQIKARSTSSESVAAPLELEFDGHRLVLSAKDEIVLRCGKASITLTRAGKVLVLGEYVLSRAAGVNRIRGGSVQIN